MKIILQEDVTNLGKVGDVINVAPGYARNYLLPKKLAVLASSANAKIFEQRQKTQVKRDAKDREQALKLAEEIAKISVRISRKTGENDVLYGSVTAMDIADALLANKFEIDRRKIILEEPIKNLGEHNVPIKLYRDVTAELKVFVEKEQG